MLCFGPWPRLVPGGMSPGVWAQDCFLQGQMPSAACDLHLLLSAALGNGIGCPASQFQRRGSEWSGSTGSRGSTVGGQEQMSNPRPPRLESWLRHFLVVGPYNMATPCLSLPFCEMRGS